MSVKRAKSDDPEHVGLKTTVDPIDSPQGGKRFVLRDTMRLP